MFPPLITTPTFLPPTRPSSSRTAASAAAPAPSASSFVRSSNTTIARDLEGGGVRLVVALACEHRLRAGALDRGELRERHADRQHDAGRNAKQLRGECDALPVIAG